MNSLNRIDQRFQSGNSVTVDKASVPATEWNDLVVDINAYIAATKDLLWYISQIELLVYDESEAEIDHVIVAKAKQTLAKLK